MTSTPWRIASQALVILNPETAEPALTLAFSSDPAAAEQQRLRIQPFDRQGAAVEIVFATGGYQIGPVVTQPRWLRPFERVDPNLYLDDDEKAQEHAAALGDQQREAYEVRRADYLRRRDEWNAPADPLDADFTEPVPAKVDPKTGKAQSQPAA